MERNWRRASYPAGFNVLKVVDSLSTFNQPKRRMQRTAPCRRYSHKATIEEKTNTCIDRRHATYNRGSQTIGRKLNSCFKAHTTVNTVAIDSERKLSNGKGSFGQWRFLQSRWTLTLGSWQSLAMRCPIGFEFSTPQTDSYFGAYWWLVHVEKLPAKDIFE